MSFVKDLKYEFSQEPILTTYRLLIYPLVLVMIFASALTCGVAATILNLSFSVGFKVFMGVLRL